MKISVNESYFRRIYGGKRRSDREAISLCREAGFDTVDFNLGDKTPEENIILRNNYVDDAKSLREYCDGMGIDIDQAHARFDYERIPSDDFTPQMKRTVEVAKILGVKNIVVHADSNWSFFKEDTLRQIYDTYAPMVDAAKSAGVGIAMETLFENKTDTRRRRFCSYVDELDAIVSKFNDPCVGICWDFGHAKVSYEERQFEMMRKVGSKITSTHVHDNYYDHDLHLPPFLGNTDWEEAIRALKDINYNGTFTLELVYGCMPEALMLDYAKFNHKIASYLVNRIEN